MAVSINDFEVLAAEPPAAQNAGRGNQGTQENEERLSLEELDEMMQRELERLARLWAH